MKKEQLKTPLPHHKVGSHPVHVTYRLKGSIPVEKLKALLNERDKLFSDQPSSNRASEWIEAGFENLLHEHSNGPYHLQRADILQVVLDSWQFISDQNNLYIYAICVMGNHVHILFQRADELVLDLGKLMKAHKNFTALQSNKILGNTGKSFWANGYFDRDLRPKQFTTIMWYILNNPVKAKLVSNWRDWPGTYLNPDYDSLFR